MVPVWRSAGTHAPLRSAGQGIGDHEGGMGVVVLGDGDDGIIVVTVYVYYGQEGAQE